MIEYFDHLKKIYISIHGNPTEKPKKTAKTDAHKLQCFIRAQGKLRNHLRKEPRSGCSMVFILGFCSEYGAHVHC